MNRKSETLIIFFAFVYKCYWTPDYLWLLIIHREMDIEQKQAEHIDFFVKQASALKGSALTTVIVEATSHPSLFAFSEILSVPSVLEVSIHSYYYFYTCSDFVWSFFFFFMIIGLVGVALICFFVILCVFSYTGFLGIYPEHCVVVMYLCYWLGNIWNMISFWVSVCWVFRKQPLYLLKGRDKVCAYTLPYLDIKHHLWDYIWFVVFVVDGISW